MTRITTIESLFLRVLQSVYFEQVVSCVVDIVRIVYFFVFIIGYSVCMRLQN